MTPSLRVVTPGLMSTIQDRGRHGYQHLGVSVCGALDPVSLAAANVLAGNAPETGALEIACVGPTLAVETDDVRLAIVTAGTVALDILDEAGEHLRRAAAQQSQRLRRGEILRIGALSGASVAYLAVEGGFGVEPVLGSVSTDLRSGIGGFNGRAIAAGDRLPLRQLRARERDEASIPSLPVGPRPRVRVVIGPQQDHFPDSEVAAFLSNAYSVGPSADRMAMRLAGSALRHRRGFDIVSDSIAPGSIQVPGDGRPIVLLADRQTTGGYPKIATVISADLPGLARLPIGAPVRFEAVTMDEAVAARRDHLADLAGLCERLVPLLPEAPDIATRLSDCNLVSGFIDAAA